MRCVIVGASELGRHLARHLVEEGREVVVVDHHRGRLQELEEQLDVATVEGEGYAPAALGRACEGGAELLAATTHADDTNLLAAIVGREAGARHAAARVQGVAFNPDDTRGIHRGLLGIDLVVHPRVLVAREIGRIVRSHGALHSLTLADGRIELAQVELPGSGRMLHRPLAEIQWPAPVLVAGIVRDERFFVPGGSDVLLPGDRAWLVGRAHEIDRALEAIRGELPAARVVLVGGGSAGQAIARVLEGTGVELLVIERSAREARRFAERFPAAEVIHGDGTDLDLLREEGVDRRDLFCAVSHDDEVNLMSALLARRLGAPRTLALVHRPEVQDVFRELGVDVTLSPRLAAADAILDLARKGTLRAITSLEEGEAEVLRFQVAEGMRILHHDLARLDLPRGALLLAILRGDDARVPHGGDRVEAGDEVLVLATRSARRSVERFFRRPLV